MVLRRVLRGAGRAAATAAAIVLLSPLGASAQTTPLGNSYRELLLETRPGECNPELIAATEQRFAQLRPRQSTSSRQPLDPGRMRTTSGRGVAGSRRDRRDAREQRDAALAALAADYARMLDYYKSMCPETESAIHVWVREPNTLANAVWEEVIGRIFLETLRRERDIENVPSLELRLAVEEQRYEKTYRERGAVPPPPPEGSPLSLLTQMVEQLRAEIAQPLPIYQRLLEAGLTKAEYDVLSQLAIDAVNAENETLKLVTQQVVCERRDTFESPAAFGRATDERWAIVRAEREQAVARLLEAIDLKTAEKVVQYTLAVGPDTMSWLNHEATYPQFEEAYLERLLDTGCREPVSNLDEIRQREIAHLEERLREGR